jgi:tyrosyl-tRNA synthetase
MGFTEELKWRGLLHDIMPGTEELLDKESTNGYIGFDPTADSLHIGNLVPIMLLVHFQRHGHKPYALVGGATGMVGDPSGKTQERQLLTLDIINHNLACQKRQLEKFLNFNCGKNSAEIVNNYDWFKDFSFLDFIRDVGKHITVNYMMSKDSVKNRLESGMSFTEFSYQLVQGYDFYYLYKNHGCKIQMGGSDQWGNITTGSELIRRMDSGEAYAITAPLVKKADGTKFGKSEGGNIWLDKSKTSPYKFFQFWLNTSDEDVKNYIRTFSLLNQLEIESLEKKHLEVPHLRILQKALAEELTIRVHSEIDLQNAKDASEILFGNTTKAALENLSEDDFMEVFSGVEKVSISKKIIEAEIDIAEFLSDTTKFLSSRGEARRALAENSISINKEKITDGYKVSLRDVINSKFIVLQRGKKKYFLVGLGDDK